MFLSRQKTEKVMAVNVYRILMRVLLPCCSSPAAFSSCFVRRSPTFPAYNPKAHEEEGFSPSSVKSLAYVFQPTDSTS